MLERENNEFFKIAFLPSISAVQLYRSRKLKAAPRAASVADKFALLYLWVRQNRGH